MSKMKLLSYFQLATLLTYFAIAMVQATSLGIFNIYYAMAWIMPMVKWRPNMKKMVITVKSLMELVYCLLSIEYWLKGKPMGKPNNRKRMLLICY